MEAGGWTLPNAVSFGEVFDRYDNVAGHGAELETGGNRRAEARARMELMLRLMAKGLNYQITSAKADCRR